MPDAEDVRTIALSLPETTEKIAWSMPTFRVAGKMFATLPEEETSIAVRCPKEERDELVLAEPKKFWIADHEASFAWVRARLAALDDTDELRAILTDSWRQAAPPRLLDTHPEPVPPTADRNPVGAGPGPVA
ncbi:MmcQ/YjbR family DNA-binding protein [Streptomyces sp. NPDC102406]|uniref:MmcQ/YjbR family DNA-binding protein n=1 Tax=Streptomyces sp. NPDC102406 TaxID=3366171 RepID=UPI0038038B7D